jgi:hypothetical protein
MYYLVLKALYLYGGSAKIIVKLYLFKELGRGIKVMGSLYIGMVYCALRALWVL